VPVRVTLGTCRHFSVINSRGSKIREVSRPIASFELGRMGDLVIV
jgi:hypothetical protein